MKDIKKDPFGEYIRNLPPTRKELGAGMVYCNWIARCRWA